MATKQQIRSHTWSAACVSSIITNSTTIIEPRSKYCPEFRATVHKDLLCFYSSYYRAALTGGFAEHDQAWTDLDMTAKHCESFVGWLYTGQMLQFPTIDRAALFVFADKTENLALRRSVMTSLIAGIQAEERFLPLPLSVVEPSLRELPSTSPLYRWMVDTFVHHWDPIHLNRDFNERTIDGIPQTFFFNVSRCLVVKNKQSTNMLCFCCRNPCNFHEHESHQEWEATCGLPGEYPLMVTKLQRPLVEFLKQPIARSGS